MLFKALAVVGLSVLGGAAKAEEDFQQSSERGTVQVQYLLNDLRHPWGMAFLPDGQLLITERSGQLRSVAADFTGSSQVSGVPQV
ncbi:PQQ-dependent sugar dehydrogenase [Pseudomonas viridiflava]|uniref:PQQ-dependent sugar dehydrogenase n=1 Tax=Pseudomonas viridiflava TaxID=33069 RepID=UPI000F070654|nr:PQQ-dependent sugar dehydrogenase [Pseudomonas viridiflava]